MFLGNGLGMKPQVVFLGGKLASLSSSAAWAPAWTILDVKKRISQACPLRELSLLKSEAVSFQTLYRVKKSISEGELSFFSFFSLIFFILLEFNLPTYSVTPVLIPSEEELSWETLSEIYFPIILISSLYHMKFLFILDPVPSPTRYLCPSSLK